MDEHFLSTVEAALRRNGMLRHSTVLLVALSGGADSVSLLHAVHALATRHGFHVRAAHVEHGLRGQASLDDASFCSELCYRLSVPLTCDHAALPGDMHTSGVEARAREARYALLLRRARECAADALLLAHHQEDQAETVLAHLVRGSGAQGLGGMREATLREGVLLLRPMLALSRQAVLAALDGLPYRVDETNAEACCQRNRLRLQVMPLLTQENPQAASHIAQSAALLAMDEDYLSVQAHALLNLALIDAPPILCLKKAALLASPPALAIRALRAFVALGLTYLTPPMLSVTPPHYPLGQNQAIDIASENVTLSAVHGQRLCADRFPCTAPVLERSLSAADSRALLALLNAAAGASMNLPGGLSAQVTQHFMHLVRMADGSPVVSAPLPAPVLIASISGHFMFSGFSFTVEPYGVPGSVAPNGRCAAVISNALWMDAQLRTPRPGDRFHPFGATGGKPLRRYLSDHKLDLPFRACLPVLCQGSEVLWAVGLGASERTRLTDAPAVLISVTGDIPWVKDDLPTPHV